MRKFPRRSQAPDLLEPEEPAPRRLRRGWWWAAGATFVAASVVVAVNSGDDLGKVAGTVKLTGEARKFTLESVRPGLPEVSLEQLRGRPAVLNFFASWCNPCIREMPAFQALAERYEDRVSFVGVTFNDRLEEARTVVAQTGVRYPTAFDPTSEVANDYAVRVMPTTFFIGADGNLLERKDGEISEAQLRRVIERLFPAS